MTTHVFIVNAITFKYHLEYMFVGTGMKDSVIDFIIVQQRSLRHKQRILFWVWLQIFQGFKLEI